MKITAITHQLRAENRYSIFVDGKYAFSLSDGALLESRIVNGEEIDSTRLKELQKLSLDDKAYQRVLDYIALRARSTWEVQEYLRRKEVEAEVAQSILNRLSNAGLLDDRDFAGRWIANRRLLKTISRRKLELELRQKHIPNDIVQDALDEDKAETDELTILRQLVERKRAKYPDKQKLLAYLSRQGYSYDDIKVVLNEETTM